MPKLAGGLRPIAKWVMFVGALFVYPIRIGTWLFRRGLFARGISACGGRGVGFVGGSCSCSLVIGPGVLLAAAWAMRYLSTAIGWGCSFGSPRCS